jgi:hypothetical protein
VFLTEQLASYSFYEKERKRFRKQGFRGLAHGRMFNNHP